MNKIEWNEIKTAYLSSPSVTLKEVAEKFGVPAQSVRRRSSKEKWSQQKKQAATRMQHKVEKAMKEVEDLKAKEMAEQLGKINKIADKLLDRLGEGAEHFEKPTQIMNMSTALKELLSIVRNTNSLPTWDEEQKYNIAREKLELEKKKLNLGDDDEDKGGGVVLLPEVLDDEQ